MVNYVGQFRKGGRRVGRKLSLCFLLLKKPEGLCFLVGLQPLSLESNGVHGVPFTPWSYFPALGVVASPHADSLCPVDG